MRKRCEWPSAAGLAAAAIGACCALAPPAGASSVVDMNLPTLADHAGQVIVGQVASVRSYWGDAPRRIETEVTFEHVHYLKGQRSDSTPTFVLVVPGGSVGDWTARVADAPIFTVDDQWVLFLLPEYRTFPTVGLAQGALRVQTGADGIARVYDALRRPVLGFDPDGFVQFDTAPGPGVSAGLRGATHLRVHVSPPGPAADAMTYEHFVSHVRPVLERSRVHDLNGPAGRPVRVQHHPVPLRCGPHTPDTPATLRSSAARVTPAGRALLGASAGDGRSQP